MNIATGTSSAKTINIGTGASTTNTLFIGSGSSTVSVDGNLNLASSTSALTVNIANGTGAHTINIGTGGTNAKTINIGTAANTLNVVTIGAASSTIAFTSASWTISTAGTSTFARTATSSTIPTSPADGSVMFLRTGNSPFDFMRFTYDATYGKWVSDVQWWPLSNSTESTMTTAGGAGAAWASRGAEAVFPWKPLSQAGFTPTARYIVEAYDSGTSGQVRTVYQTANAGGALSAVTQLHNTTTTATTSTFFDTGWTSFPSLPAATDFLIVRNQGSSATGGTSLTIARSSVGIRWEK